MHLPVIDIGSGAHIGLGLRWTTWQAEVKELAGTNNNLVFYLVILLVVLLHQLRMVVARLRAPITRDWTADLRSQHHLPMGCLRGTTEPTAGAGVVVQPSEPSWSCRSCRTRDGTPRKEWTATTSSWRRTPLSRSGPRPPVPARGRGGVARAVPGVLRAILEGEERGAPSLHRQAPNDAAKAQRTSCGSSSTPGWVAHAQPSRCSKVDSSPDQGPLWRRAQREESREGACSEETAGRT